MQNIQIIYIIIYIILLLLNNKYNFVYSSTILPINFSNNNKYNIINEDKIKPVNSYG